jgi:hypothetical protein
MKFRKIIAPKLGPVSTVTGKRKAVGDVTSGHRSEVKYRNDVHNPINSPIYNPINNARKIAAKREVSRLASQLFPSLQGVWRYTDVVLHYLVAMFMRRSDVAPLWLLGSKSTTYWFFWTCESEKGWRATPEELDSAESKESMSWLITRDNAMLRGDSGMRKVDHEDLFFEGTPVRILRVAIGVVKEDVAEMECEGCRQTVRTLGYAGNQKIGGTPTRRKKGNIHGLSLLVIPNFAKLGLVLGEQFRADFAARVDGSEGIALPAEPPASFVPPPTEESDAFVLGGFRFLAARGLGDDEEKKAAAEFVEIPESVEVEEEKVEWDGKLYGKNVYFSCQTPSDEQKAGIVKLGGKCFSGMPSKNKNPMTLLFVKVSSEWRCFSKGMFALENKVPVAFFEELDEVLMEEEEEEEEEEEDTSFSFFSSPHELEHSCFLVIKVYSKSLYIRQQLCFRKGETYVYNTILTTILTFIIFFPPLSLSLCICV